MQFKSFDEWFNESDASGTDWYNRLAECWDDAWDVGYRTATKDRCKDQGHYWKEGVSPSFCIYCCEEEYAYVKED